jgi:hypothetical protein
VVPEICRPGDNMSAICRPETGENMSAQKKFLGGAAPEPPHGGLRPPAPPLLPPCAKNITHTQHQQLTHAPQQYNMNATQSCINNQHTIAIISELKHKSFSHSINQHKPHHNIHTKNALSIHYKTSKSIHQDNNVTIPEFLWQI